MVGNWGSEIMITLNNPSLIKELYALDATPIYKKQ